MTVTTLDGKSLCEVLAENYKRTLPANCRGVKWTGESFAQWVKLRYPEITFAPGQEWRGIGTLVGGKSVNYKYWFICDKHGPYEAMAHHILSQTAVQIGSQCAGCRAAKSKQRRDAITTTFVGRTTADGHLILEHVGYKATPSDVARGRIGNAVYRYKCSVCGNQQATALGNNLKKHGNTNHCGCLSSRDSRNTFTRSEAKANSPCLLYIFSTINSNGIKVGIARNVKARATKSYEHQLFISQTLKRSEAWAVEQVTHHLLRSMGLQYDLQDCPDWEEIEGTDKREAGSTEVFYSFDLASLIPIINDYISEVEAIGWQALLDRYIPIDEMNHLQLFYWDGEHQRQSSGEGYIGHSVRSVFDLQTI